MALRSSDGRRFRLLTLGADGACPDRGRDLPADGLAVAAVVAAGSFLYESDLGSSAYTDLAELADGGFASAVVTSLQVGGLPIGALTVSRRGDRGFGEEDWLMLLHAGALVASAIKHLRTVAELDRAETERQKARLVLGRRSNELRSTCRITAAIAAGDLTQAIGVVVNEISSLRGIELCRILAVEPVGFGAGASLPLVALGAKHGAAFHGQLPELGDESPDAVAAATGKVIVWRNPSADEAERAALRRLGVTSVASVPIVVAGAVIGVLTAGSTGGHRLVTDEHVVLLDLVASDLGAAAGDVGPLIAASSRRTVSDKHQPSPALLG